LKLACMGVLLEIGVLVCSGVAGSKSCLDKLSHSRQVSLFALADAAKHHFQCGGSYVGFA